MNQLEKFYKGKRVLVTGHTGFKGVWLSAWLNHLGAEVIGLSLEPPSSPNNFDVCRMQEHTTHIIGDVTDVEVVRQVFAEHKPQVVFHLAAQALVRASYQDPYETFNVNLMGTVYVLEEARRCDSVEAVVSITSDKCYRNKQWAWGYRETDELGGYDPYSASKACAELIVECLMDERYQQNAALGSIKPIASARAGNVIGGGDWALDRIIPDTIRSIVKSDDVLIRSPNSTRPWQHVLEPLSGYLWLAVKLAQDSEHYQGGWNFGPRDVESWTVKDIVEGILERWNPTGVGLIVNEDTSGAESQLLRLDCGKARESLDWVSVWTVPQVLDAIVGWYSAYYDAPDSDIYPLLIEQISQFSADAKALNRAWAMEVSASEN